MQGRRTDLALEARTLWEESAGRTTRLAGVRAYEGEENGIPVTRVEVLDRRGAQALGKPVGTYVTLETQQLTCRREGAFRRTAQTVAEQLRKLLPALEPNGLVLLAGLGNRSITPDAVGPLTHEHMLVTRHLVRRLPEQFGHLRPVASVAAEVLGNTGVESSELVQSVCRKLRPDCVIAVDALACRSVDRLCRTVQLADTGIVPGSGVGNHRAGLDRETLGVPVIAVGVPTVVEAATLAADLAGTRELPELDRSLLVTPKDIDGHVALLGKLLGYAISLALQPELTLEDLEQLLE